MKKWTGRGGEGSAGEEALAASRSAPAQAPLESWFPLPNQAAVVVVGTHSCSCSHE